MSPEVGSALLSGGRSLGLQRRIDEPVIEEFAGEKAKENEERSFCHKEYNLH